MAYTQTAAGVSAGGAAYFGLVALATALALITGLVFMGSNAVAMKRTLAARSQDAKKRNEASELAWAAAIGVQIAAEMSALEVGHDEEWRALLERGKHWSWGVDQFARLKDTYFGAKLDPQFQAHQGYPTTGQWVARDEWQHFLIKKAEMICLALSEVESRPTHPSLESYVSKALGK